MSRVKRGEPTLPALTALEEELKQKLVAIRLQKRMHLGKLLEQAGLADIPEPDLVHLLGVMAREMVHQREVNHGVPHADNGATCDANSVSKPAESGPQ